MTSTMLKEVLVVADDPAILRIHPKSLQVRTTVEDHGGRIPGKVRDRVFEPFFTTKQTGMGLGLAISRTIVEAYGGRIWVNPNLDRGVTFHVTLPLSTEEEE